MGCGCNKSKASTDLYTWKAADNKQTVTNLTRVEANTRMNRKGGTIEKQ